jgi:uroporphyrinogen-III decarboxylase
VNSYEIVRRAVRFGTPERLPLVFDSMGVSDKRGVGPNFSSDRTSGDGTGADHFGCEWAKTEAKNMGQVKGHPLEDWRALAGYRWPDPDNPAWYANVAQRTAEAEAEGKYVTMGIFMLLFERMHSLRGFTPTLEDLYLEPDLSAELADRLVEFDCRVIENTVSAAGSGRLHGLGFTDDWGTQQSCFVSPDFWREFFAPRYKRIFDLCHANDMDVWMHSCGKVNELLGPLEEIGCDAINLQQPRALGIEEVGANHRGRICFVSLCDIQHTLPFKGEGEIREEAALLLEHWATPEGGFVLSDYGDGEAIGVPLEKKQLMLEAFCELDPWARASGAAHPVPAMNHG